MKGKVNHCKQSEGKPFFWHWQQPACQLTTAYTKTHLCTKLCADCDLAIKFKWWFPPTVFTFLSDTFAEPNNKEKGFFNAVFCSNRRSVALYLQQATQGNLNTKRLNSNIGGDKWLDTAPYFIAVSRLKRSGGCMIHSDTYCQMPQMQKYTATTCTCTVRNKCSLNTFCVLNPWMDTVSHFEAPGRGPELTNFSRNKRWFFSNPHIASDSFHLCKSPIMQFGRRYCSGFMRLHNDNTQR